MDDLSHYIHGVIDINNLLFDNTVYLKKLLISLVTNINICQFLLLFIEFC